MVVVHITHRFFFLGTREKYIDEYEDYKLLSSTNTTFTKTY